MTTASSIVWLPLWEVARDAGPNTQRPLGGELVEALPDERMRLEYFDTHEEPAGFTAAAVIYER